MTITVTATQGGSTANGLALRVFVLTQAAAVQNGATANTQFTAGAASTSITTTQTGSRVYGAAAWFPNTAFTPNGVTASVDDIPDTTNNGRYDTFKAASLTGTPGATTIGGTAGTAAGPLALAEVKTAGTLTEDASGTGLVASTTAATTVTTGSFTPPAGALLVALVASDGGASVTTMTVSGGGLTWTEQVKNNPSGGDYAGVWTAQVPAAVTGAPAVLHAVRRLIPRRPRLSFIRAGMTPGSGVAFVPPAPLLTRARLRQPPRRPRSRITTGWQPPVIVPPQVQAERRPAARRPRGSVTAGIPVTAVVVTAAPAPVITQARRRQMPRRVPGRIVTGMTPGSGVPFVPPAPVTTGAVRRQPPWRPRGRITGPATPAAVVSVVLPAPRVVRAAGRPAPPRRRGRLAGPLTPGVPPVTPVVPGPLRATRRPPAGRSRPVRLQRALAASSFVPPAFSVGALTAADQPGSQLTVGSAASALTAATVPGATLTISDQRTGGPA